VGEVEDEEEDENEDEEEGILRGSFIRQPVRTRKRWAFFCEKSVRIASGKRQRSVRNAEKGTLIER
jgi:hypothetical protein